MQDRDAPHLWIGLGLLAVGAVLALFVDADLPVVTPSKLGVVLVVIGAVEIVAALWHRGRPVVGRR